MSVAFETVNPTASRAELDPILPHLDLFAPSRTEALTLTGETDPKKMVANFRRQMPRGLIGIKLDSESMRSSRAAVALLLPLQKLEKDALTLLPSPPDNRQNGRGACRGHTSRNARHRVHLLGV